MGETTLIPRGGQLVPTLVPRGVRDVLERVGELKEARDQVLPDLYRTSQVISGGKDAVRALIGDKAGKDDPGDLPIANYLRDAHDALAGRLGAMPELRVDAPSTGRSSDSSEAPLKAAEKRARIVAAYDDADELELAHLQLARWLPTAGFSVATIDPVTRMGHPYPSRTFHHPLDTALAQWSPLSDPADLGIFSRVPLRELKRIYPLHADALDGQQREGGGVILGQGSPDRGVEVVRYYDEHGTWWVVPDRGLLLDFLPNPLESSPAFVAWVAPNYRRMRGYFDDLIGMMISMARLNILAEISVREDVFAPTNIFGSAPLTGPYKKGRNVQNIFDPNTKVDIPQRSSQFMAWQQIDRLERQLSIEATIPPQDRGEAGMSFVTGRGMNELASRVGRKVAELHTVIARGDRKCDERMLEYDEKSWPSITKPMRGQRKGASFSESYTPKTHIKGNYATRREFGAMAGVEEAVKLNGLAIMDSAGWVSKRWVRENIDGLGDVSEVEEQARGEAAEQAVLQMILAHANNPESPEHMRAFQMAVELLPAGATRTLAEKWLTERGDELSEQEAAMLEAEQQPAAPPDPTTVLARLTSGGDARGGVQTIQRTGGGMQV